MITNVLFLCTGNSARSILAEAILGRLGEGRFTAFSAGSQPAGRVNPAAITLLEAKGFDVSGFRSKSWDEFAGDGAPRMEIVITVCDSAASESCPVWVGHPVTVHWGIPDPAAVTGDEATVRAAFEEAYATLEARLEKLVRLDCQSLSSSEIKAALLEIAAS